MTAKELIAQLQQYDLDTEVWIPGTTPKGIPTYATLDHLVPCKYGSLVTDLTDTPDKIDMRLLGDRPDDATIIVLSYLYDFQK